MDLDEKEQAEKALEDVLQKWVHIFGPRQCDHPFHGDEFETIPSGLWVPSGWVLAADWSSTETGDTWTTIVAPESMPRSQKIGLSTMAANTYI